MIVSPTSYYGIYFGKPEDRESEATSAMASKANEYRHCIARSYIVGMPKGRFFFYQVFDEDSS